MEGEHQYVSSDTHSDAVVYDYWPVAADWAVPVKPYKDDISSTYDVNSLWDWLPFSFHQVINIILKFRGINPITRLPFQLHYFKSSKSNCFHLRLSPNGRHLAAFLDEKGYIFEVDNKLKVSEKYTFILPINDKYPQWRKFEWDEEGNVLAVACGDGSVFIVIPGAGFIPIERFSDVVAPSEDSIGSRRVAAISIIYTKTNSSQTGKRFDVFILRYNGNLHRYSVNTDGLSMEKEYPPISLSRLHSGVCCMLYDTKHQLLVIAGGATTYEKSGSITAWKLVDESPFMKLVASVGNKGDDSQLTSDKMSAKQKLQCIVNTLQTKSAAFIKHISISPSGNTLATLTMDGGLTVWNFPSLRFNQYWSPNTIEGAFTPSEPSEGPKIMHTQPQGCNLVQVEWWSENEFVFLRDSGEVIITSINAPESKTGTASKFTPGAKLTKGVAFHFFVLEKVKENQTRRAKQRPKQKESIETDDKQTTISKTLLFAKQCIDDIVGEAEDDTASWSTPTTSIESYDYFRISCFAQSTPERMFLKKIEENIYAEALSLSKKYPNLNTDLVYQKQWLLSEVSSESITNFLSNIRDHSWVLRECQYRIPSTIAQLELLLDYGKSLCISLKKELTSITSPWGIEVALYHMILLRFENRLKSYKEISKGKLNPQEFLQYRKIDLVEIAISLASREEIAPLTTLFTFYRAVLAPYHLRIISSFPEYTRPSLYVSLLPPLDTSIPAIEPDEIFTEYESVLAAVELQQNTCDLYNDTLWLLKAQQRHSPLPKDYFPQLEKSDLRDSELLNEQIMIWQPDTDDIGTWFVNRAKEIDLRSGFLLNSTELLAIGIDSKVPDLDSLKKDADFLANLVYYHGLEDVCLHDFLQLNNFEKLKLILKGCTPDNIAEQIRECLTSLIEKEGEKLLYKYMEEIAPSQISLCAEIIKSSRPFDKNEKKIPKVLRIVQHKKDLIEISLKCAYLNTSTDQWRTISDIFLSLPARDATNKTGEALIEYNKLHDAVDEFEKHLNGCEILSKYKLAPTLNFFKQSSTNLEIEAKKLIYKLTHLGSKRNYTDDEWTDIFHDIKHLCVGAFNFLPLHYWQEQFIDGLLSIGRFHVIESLINVQNQEDVVIKCAHSFFDSALHYTDSNIELSNRCLKLLSPISEKVIAETNFFKAFETFVSFGIFIIPAKIRVMPKLELIRIVIRSNDENYKHTEKIILMSRQFGVAKEDLLRLRFEMALDAYKRADYHNTLTNCLELIKSNYPPTWDLCMKLSLLDPPTRIESSARAKMLAFAIANAPVDKIETLLHLWAEHEKEHPLLLQNKFDFDLMNSIPTSEPSPKVSTLNEPEPVQSIAQPQSEKSKINSELLAAINNCKTVADIKALPQYNQVVEEIIKNTTWFNNTNSIRNITESRDKNPQHSLLFYVCLLVKEENFEEAIDAISHFYLLHSACNTYNNMLLMIKVFLEMHAKSPVLPALYDTTPDSEHLNLTELATQSLQKFHASTSNVFK